MTNDASPAKISPRILAAVGLVVVAGLGLAAYFLTKTETKTVSTANTTVMETAPVSVEGAALPVLPETGADPAVGNRAPKLSGSGFDGTTRSFEPGKGPMIVMFVAHWCPHCRREVPLVAKWAADGTVDGVPLKAVSTGVVRENPNYPPSAWLTKDTWPVDTMVDDDSNSAASAFGLPGFPYFVALNASGNVVKRSSGELSETDFRALAKAAVS